MCPTDAGLISGNGQKVKETRLIAADVVNGYQQKAVNAVLRMIFLFEIGGQFHSRVQEMHRVYGRSFATNLVVDMRSG